MRHQIPGLHSKHQDSETRMAEVGRLFNANELIVAEVLQSAEAMKPP